MSSRPRLVRRVARLLLWGFLVVIAVLAGAVGALGYTDPGHALLLKAALPLAEGALSGRLRVGRLDGSLLSVLVLNDVAVEDPEGRVAVAARRLEVRYRLAALLDGRVEVTLLHGDGIVVDAGYLRDGRLNLAALARPSRTPPDDKPGTAQVRVNDVRLDATVRWQPPPSRAIPGPRIALRLGLAGGASVRGDRVDLEVQGLDVTVAEPLVASLHASARARVGVAPAVEGLGASIEAEGAAIDQLLRLLPGGALPGGRLLGRWRADLTAAGQLSGLDVGVVLHPPRGTLTVKGNIDVDALAWRGTVAVRDLDPGAAWSGAPHGDIALDAAAHGRAAAGAVDLVRLEVRAAPGRVEARGRATLDGSFDADVRVEAPDLRRLRAFAVPGVAPLPALHGSLGVQAHAARQGGQLTAEVTLTGSRLAVPGARVGHLLLTARTRGADALSVTLRAVDPGALRGTLSLALQGTPRWRGGSPVGFDGTLDDLRLSAVGDPQAQAKVLRLTAPARLHLGEEVGVMGLALGLGGQRLFVDGSYHLGRRTVSAQVRGEGLDLRELLALFAPSPSSPGGGDGVPQTRLDVKVSVTGSASAPVAQLAVEGRSGPWGPLSLDALTHRLGARYRAGRLSGELLSTGAGADAGAGPRLRARFDLPLPPGDAPLDADVHLELPAVQRFAALLPKALASLHGALSADVRIGGSTRRPELLLTLLAPDWGLGELQRSAVTARAEWRDGRIGARCALKLARGAGPGVGALAVEMDAPLELDPLRPPADLQELLLHRTPVDLRVELGELDLGRVPWASLGLSPPAGAGTLRGSVRLHGTGDDPALAVDVTARGVALPPLRRPLDATLRADWRGAQAHLDAGVSGGGRALLFLRGSAGLAVKRLLEGKPWRDTPITLNADVPGLDLAMLPDLAGSADGKIVLRGTLGCPEGEVAVRLSRLRYQGLDLGELHLDGKGGIDDTRATARLGLRQPLGGNLDLDADIPHAAGSPWRVALLLRQLDLRSLAAAVPAVRRVEARLDAGLTLGGTRADPRLAGFLRVRDGTVEMDNQPAPYRNIELDVAARDGLVELKRLGLRFQKGTLGATGRLRLAGLRPVGLDGAVEAERFPLTHGDMVGHLDALVRVEGQAHERGVHSTITVERGTLQLPKLEGGPDTQAVGALADVEFNDKAARAAAGQTTRAAGDSQPLTVNARVPGPFYLRGPDVSADLQGDVRVDLTGARVRLAGAVEVPRGTVQIAERPYTVVQARANFDGTDDTNPALDARLARDVQGAQLIIEVTGTAQAPRITLRSEPPIYDQTQLITMVATGDDGAKSSSADKPIEQQVEQKIVGALSGLLVSKLKEEFGGYLPIEVLKLDVGYQGLDAVPHARLEVGKYLFNNLYVSYAYQNAPQTSQRRLNNHEAHLEYSFPRNFSVLATFGDAAVGAIDFYWNHRF